MKFINLSSKLFVILSVLMVICQSHPVKNTDGSYTKEQTEVALTRRSDELTNAKVRGSSSSPDPIFKVFKAESKTRESVNLESEALPSKILSLYDNSQKKIADNSQPLPILDTISEHEKYGNNGDMFKGISRGVVNGYEAFSNFLNHLIQGPREIARSISKSITAQLDVIGGKIVGL